ncbi:MAG: sensor histidine kinase [Caldilineaceae bacterium]|nr:sensor histidine kinase [Caldilineaceae bacterium]MDE0463527.1 sensor histidine kinase [Caldilineaceae bacterium]
MNEEQLRFYQQANFSLFLCAQLIICITMGWVFVLKGSPPSFVSLTGPLFFSILLWNMPRNSAAWQPHLYLAIQCLIVIAIMASTREYIVVTFYFILAGQAMMKFSPRSRFIWISVFVFITLAGNFYWQLESSLDSPVRVLLIVFGFTATLFLCHGIARARRDQEEFQRLLRETREYTAEAKLLAVSEERNRLSRDLHDTLGHRLTVSIVQLEGMARLLEKGVERKRIARMIEVVHGQLTEGLNELRNALTMLRNLKSDGNALTDSLQQLINEFTIATGITHHIQLPEKLPPLSDAQYMTIYRMVQEALTNTQKHAQAEFIWVVLEVREDALILTVQNDGQDFDASKGYGYGLQGIHERAMQLDGALDVIKPVAGGILLTLSLPIQKEEARSHA